VEVTSVVALGSSKFRASSLAPEDRLGFLTQNSAYNAWEDVLVAWEDVLVEVVSTRLPRDVRAEADEQVLGSYLRVQ
jgi:hypothetical protein